MASGNLWRVPEDKLQGTSSLFLSFDKFMECI
jgi:hypothetical protein